MLDLYQIFYDTFNQKINYIFLLQMLFLYLFKMIQYNHLKYLIQNILINFNLYLLKFN